MPLSTCSPNSYSDPGTFMKLTGLERGKSERLVQTGVRSGDLGSNVSKGFIPPTE